MKKWRCPICNHLNSKDTQVCRCGAYKKETSYDAIADEDDLE